MGKLTEVKNIGMKWCTYDFGLYVLVFNYFYQLVLGICAYGYFPCISFATEIYALAKSPFSLIFTKYIGKMN